MASIEERTSKPDKHGTVTTTWRVRWRQNGEQPSETFDDINQAILFKNAVEKAGGRWPENYLAGKGWVTPIEYRRTLTAADPEPEPPGNTQTLSEFAAEWVASLSGIQSDTRARYRRILALHIEPWFGDAPVGDTQAISAMKIGAWVNALAAGTGAPDDIIPGDEDMVMRDPLGAKSIRNVHGVLSSLLQAAVDAEPALRATNPCRKTKLPRPDTGEDDEEMTFLEPEEVDLILAEIREDARALIDFLAGTGLRYSEATALQVQDVDLLGDQPCLRVRRAWKKGDTGPWYLGPPKTPRSRRRLGLSELQVLDLAPLVAGKGRSEFVFTRPTGAHWGHSTFYTQRWRPAIYKAMRCSYHRERDLAAGIGRRGFRFLRSEHIVPCGCPGVLEKIPRLHDLRHTHVAWMIADKTPLPLIQRRLGHESITTTIDRYGHLMPELEGEMLTGLDVRRTRGRMLMAVA